MKQLRGILWFLPAAIILSLLAAALFRPRVERSLQVAVEKTAHGTRYTAHGAHPTPPNRRVIPSERSDEGSNSQLKEFDPNTIDAAGFVKLGFTSRQARAILNFRAAIGGFRTPDQLAECYVVSPEMFDRLKPYIVLETVPETTPARRTPTSEKVELNTADSTRLVAISGIGALTAGRILAFRRALGGFAKKEQLAEVRGMTRENYERILPQIWVDTLAIQKIDINFAPPPVLAVHPYFTPEVLRRVVKNRQLKGGWSRPEQLIEDRTLTQEQAARLAPYLTF